jgi:hypothetical protein
MFASGILAGRSRLAQAWECVGAWDIVPDKPANPERISIADAIGIFLTKCEELTGFILRGEVRSTTEIRAYHI